MNYGLEHKINYLRVADWAEMVLSHPLNNPLNAEFMVAFKLHKVAPNFFSLHVHVYTHPHHSVIEKNSLLHSIFSLRTDCEQHSVTHV